jgi:GT2 family glycosyltransferase
VQVAEFYARALVKREDPKKVRADVKAFKARFQAVKYCFNPDNLGGYEFYELARKQPALAHLV